MHLPESKARSPAGENVIPLINVVFLLLIFFMIAGAMKEPELFAVTPPDSASEAMPPEEARRVLVSADGRIALGGRDLSVDELAGLSLGEGPRIEVKADMDVPVDKLMDVLGALRQAGVEEIQLLTRRDAAPR